MKSLEAFIRVQWGIVTDHLMLSDVREKLFSDVRERLFSHVRERLFSDVSEKQLCDYSAAL